MLSDVDCRSLAEQCLARIAQQCGEDLMLMDRPFETPATLAYAYQTSDFVATGDFTHALAGNGPILVSKVTGTVDIAGTALPVEDYIQEFEAKNSRSAMGRLRTYVTVREIFTLATCYAGPTVCNRPEADEANNKPDSIIMNRKSFLLSIEALILGGPASLLFIFGSPYILMGSFYMLAQGNPLALFGTVSCLWSLLQFWKLAFSTIFKAKYKFGIGFVPALLGAVVGTPVMHIGVPDWISVALIVFPCIGVLHFTYEQLTLRRKPSLTR